MIRMVSFILVSIIVLGSSYAQDKRGTPAQAEALVKKAVTFYKENGKDKAFAAFNDLKGKFVSGDLYIFVYDLNGKCMAHGSNAKMIGKDLIELKDADGKAFVKERVEIAKSKGKGWQNYKWNNPATNTIESKTAYIEKAGDVIIGSGAYKK